MADDLTTRELALRKSSRALYSTQQQVEQETKAAAQTETVKAPTAPTKDAILPGYGDDTNVFYVDVKVFLEGVQVPHSQAAVSYGIDSPPTATLVIPAAQFLRNIPETTKVLIVFRDLLPDSTGEYKWRVLFDGELSGISYSIDSTGATMNLTAIHSTAYLTLIQLMNVPVRDYIYNSKPEANVGGLTLWQSQPGASQTEIKFLEALLNDLKGDTPSVKSMADIVYILLRNIIEGHKDSAAVARWMWLYLGNNPGGLKLLRRIYGVSDAGKDDKFLSKEALPGALVNATVMNSIKHPNGAANQTVVLEETPTTIDNGDGTYTETTGNQPIVYRVVRFTDPVGTGGDKGINSAKIIELAQSQEGIEYVLGADGTAANGTDCGQTVVSSVGEVTGINQRYVPNMVIQADQEGILTWASEDKDAITNAKAGDVLVVNKDLGHVIICDGNGGYYGASTSKKEVIHSDSIVRDFPNIVAVIHTSESTVRSWGTN